MYFENAFQIQSTKYIYFENTFKIQTISNKLKFLCTKLHYSNAKAFFAKVINFLQIINFQKKEVESIKTQRKITKTKLKDAGTICLKSYESYKNNW